jgi:hypothetical protein
MRAIVALTLLTACDQTPQLHIAVRAPAVVKLDPTRLHIEVAAEHEAQFTPTYGPANIHGQVVTSTGIDFTIGNGIGHFYAYVRAWYDTNGNNVRDAGDFVGDAVPAPIHVRSGGCSDPENRAPDLVLAPI